MRALTLAAVAACAVGATLDAQLEARLGGTVTMGTRNAAFAGNVGSGTGTMKGFELTARMKFGGISARMFGGEFSGDSGTGSVANGDLRLVLGPPMFSAEVGMGRRGYTGGVGTISWSFLRIGARSTIPVGATDFYANIGFTLYTGVKSEAGPEGNGKEAETALLYMPARMPIYVSLGYRIEQFTSVAANDDRPEEVGGIVLGLGVRLRK
jgi:hypothetical protein